MITNFSAYGNKADIPMEFKKVDLVKLFGEIRTSIDNKLKELLEDPQKKGRDEE